MSAIDERLPAELRPLAESGEWSALLDALRERVPRATSPEAQLRLLLAAARLCYAELDDGQAALALYERALQINPDEREALDTIEAIYRGMERWIELLQHLRRQVHGAAQSEHIAVLRKMAELWETELENRGQAAMCHQRILGLDPADAEAKASYERLLGR